MEHRGRNHPIRVLTISLRSVSHRIQRSCVRKLSKCLCRKNYTSVHDRDTPHTSLDASVSGSNKILSIVFSHASRSLYRRSSRRRKRESYYFQSYGIADGEPFPHMKSPLAKTSCRCNRFPCVWISTGSQGAGFSFWNFWAWQDAAQPSNELGGFVEYIGHLMDGSNGKELKSCAQGRGRYE